jgi:hypothetical protein
MSSITYCFGLQRQPLFVPGQRKIIVSELERTKGIGQRRPQRNPVDH